MTREELINHIKYNLEINADVFLTDRDARMVIKALEQEPCDDAISREAILLEIDKIKDNYGGLLDVATFIRGLPSVNPQPKTEWIHVSERLPNRDEYMKNNGLFNVSDGNRSYSEWFDIYDKHFFGEPTMTGFRVDYAVTAWMPLPAHYKESEVNNE